MKLMAAFVPKTEASKFTFKTPKGGGSQDTMASFTWLEGIEEWLSEGEWKMHWHSIYCINDVKGRNNIISKDPIISSFLQKPWKMGNHHFQRVFHLLNKNSISADNESDWYPNLLLLLSNLQLATTNGQDTTTWPQFSSNWQRSQVAPVEGITFFLTK